MAPSGRTGGWHLFDQTERSVVCPLVGVAGEFQSVGPGGWWVFAAVRWLGSADSRYGGLLFSLRLFSMMRIDSNPLFSGENDAEGLFS